MKNPKDSHARAGQEDSRPLDSVPDPNPKPPSVVKRTAGYLFGTKAQGEVWNNYQAHHAISGNQCMAGHPIQIYITKVKPTENDQENNSNNAKLDFSTVKSDTGYSINNPNNGVWLCSWPTQVEGQWPKDAEKQKSIAFEAMAATSHQWHLGGHSIEDPADPDQIYHEKYDDHVRSHLDDMVKKVRLWSDQCPFCTPADSKGPQKPFPPPYRLNNMLDSLSAHIVRQITGHPSQWHFFVSELALLYHVEKGPCRHKQGH
jgi:hypothetical protein